jgi:hypothetical protein
VIRLQARVAVATAPPRSVHPAPHAQEICCARPCEQWDSALSLNQIHQDHVEGQQATDAHPRGDETKPRQKLVYEYDFGDGSEHVILLERCSHRTGPGLPTLHSSKVRICPLEAVGGVWNRSHFWRRSATRTSRACGDLGVGWWGVRPKVVQSGRGQEGVAYGALLAASIPSISPQ